MPEFQNDGPYRRPVIQSLASARQEFNRWLAQNTLHDLRDVSGALWSLQVDLKTLPQQHDKHRPIYKLKLVLKTTLTRPGLLETGILDRKNDERLLSFLGADRIDLDIPLREMSSLDLNDLRDQFQRILQTIRQAFALRTFEAEKRRAVGEWIDSKTVFGSARLRSGQNTERA